jgi:hypothetical protein
MKLSLWVTFVILLSSATYAASQTSKDNMPSDKVAQDRERQCVQVFGDEDFCSCINSTLAKGISFQDYVNVLITPTDLLNYKELSPDNRKIVDNILRTRDQCI